MTRPFIPTLISLIMAVSAAAQVTPRPEGRPGPPPGPPHDWVRDFDSNNDGKVDAAEFNTALDATFAEIDRNANGMLDSNEMPRRPRAPRPEGPPPTGERQPLHPGERGMKPFGPDGEHKRLLPPFFFADQAREAISTSRADFDRIARGVFNEMDKNGDGAILAEESRPPRGPGRPDGPREPIAPPPPNGRFIAAELRFGDRLVKGQPFSAETVIEDTRRLFDGTTVTRSNHGAFYRDSTGRTRREQPLEFVGGVRISGSGDKPQMLVFINDFAANEQYFVDVTNKVVRKHPLDNDGEFYPRERPEKDKVESLGSKTIEGVRVDGTRITFEIPAGQIGNDKPIQVVTENWFSPELQMMVMSRHTDPIAGEHVFRLTNIKRVEQSPGLFAVPAGFRVETEHRPRPELQ